jgi:hypothetical protein
MGYRPQRISRKLDFSGTEYDGLEITVRSVPMSVMLDMLATVGAQEPTAYRHVTTTLAYALESWNVEDEEGQPVPAGLDGLLSQDPAFITAVIKAWMTAMAGGA